MTMDNRELQKKQIGLSDIREISVDAYDFLMGNHLESLDVGRYELNQGVFVNIDTYKTKAAEKLQFESHKKYIDIQFMINGSEIIRVSGISHLRRIMPYDTVRDIMFYQNREADSEYLLEQGRGIILYPEDAHMPCVCAGKKGCMVKKAVIKIPIKNVKEISYFILDVDGTLTDGKIYMGNTGELFKAFDIKDGYALHKLIPEHHVIPVILTSRESTIVRKRCEELGIHHIYQGCINKLDALKDSLEREDKGKGELLLKNCAYMGDDLPDLECMLAIKNAGGITACPADAAEEIQKVADFVSQYKGGNGAVREFAQWLV